MGEGGKPVEAIETFPYLAIIRITHILFHRHHTSHELCRTNEVPDRDQQKNQQTIFIQER